MAVAAPAIKAEMDDWVALGGRNSGIVGDDAHRSGFHRAANEVPSTDYSRRRDPNGADGPYVNWSWACAGDFWHGDDPRLLAYHRRLLARLEAGDPSLSMICEFIGQPWPDQPVLYWSRWGGRSTYRGAGHGTWTHVAWYRSRANQRANLWQEEEEMDAKQFAAILRDPTVAMLMRALPWQYVGGGIPAGMSTLKVFNETHTLAQRAAAAAGADVDEAAIVAGVLAGLDPAGMAERIAAALPAEQAKQLADELAARLAS